MPDAPPRVVALAEERAAARAAKDFAAADALRDRIVEDGWTVVDEPEGFRLEPLDRDSPPALAPLEPDQVPSVLEEAPTHDVSIQWVCEGWPEDIDRAVAAFRRHAGERRLQFVVADTAGEEPDRWGGDVEVLSLRSDIGWAAARNAGLRRSRGRIVLAMDGSVEPTGDVVGPLGDALADEGVGVCGPLRSRAT
jgi:hypothetical protein